VPSAGPAFDTWRHISVGIVLDVPSGLEQGEPSGRQIDFDLLKPSAALKHISLVGDLHRAAIFLTEAVGCHAGYVGQADEVEVLAKVAGRH